MTLTSFLQVEVLISWDGTGTFLGANDNVSADVRKWSTKRGRSKAADKVAIGTGALSIRNLDGKYTAQNSGSVIYPQVLPKRPVQITVTYNGVAYPVFRGLATPQDQSNMLSAAQVDFALVDDSDNFRFGLTNTGTLENVTSDAITSAILNDIGWGAGRRTLDVGISPVSFFTNHNRLPYNALQLAEDCEAGGLAFMGKDGNWTLQNRTYRSRQARHYSINQNTEGIRLNVRGDDVVDRVRATYPRYNYASAPEVVFSLNLPILIAPGSELIVCEVNAAGVLAAKNYIAPVAVTDFTANDAYDFGGSDKTAQVSFAVTAEYGGEVHLTATNLDSSGVYVRLACRATPLKPGGETLAYARDVATPVVVGQNLNAEFEFVDDPDTVVGWVDLQSVVRSGVPLPARITTRIVPASDAAMVAVLDAEISDRINVVDTDAVWNTHVNDDFFIESIALSGGGSSKVVQCEWVLSGRDLALGSGFRISGAFGAGFDYSTIATAGATSGYDRIWY